MRRREDKERCAKTTRRIGWTNNRFAARPLSATMEKQNRAFLKSAERLEITHSTEVENQREGGKRRAFRHRRERNRRRKGNVRESVRCKDSEDTSDDKAREMNGCEGMTAPGVEKKNCMNHRSMVLIPLDSK